MDKFKKLTFEKAFGYANDVVNGCYATLLLDTGIDIRSEKVQQYCADKQMAKSYNDFDSDTKAFARYLYVVELLESEEKD